MNKVRFENYFEFAEDVLAFYEDTRCEISIYVNTEDAAQIVRELIGQDYTCDEVFHIECIDLDVFDQEVALITLDENGGLWVENAVANNGKFLMADSEVVYTEIKYLKEVKDSTDVDDITVFAIGEEEEVPQNKKVAVLTDEDGKVGGFKYEDKQDGRCFTVEFCNCSPIENIDKMLDMYEGILDAYTKFFH